MTTEVLYTECSLATMKRGGVPYGYIEDGAVAVSNGLIAWAGEFRAIPEKFLNFKTVTLSERLVTPALIDCHTHLVFGGSRAREFEMRLEGASYEEIARAGGGILSTVSATRDATNKVLIASALVRLGNLIEEGVGVVEIKSGYGLTIDDEIRMLRIARHLETLTPVKIMTTWLAAHAIPPEYDQKADRYMDEIVIEGLRQAHEEGLVDAVDGFCENIAFSPIQIERLFKAAKSLSLPIKLHAEQLSDQKGALLTARFEGLSADHLEYLTDEDVASFADSNTVAVLLPGAYYTLRETKLPPIAALRKHDVDIAIATDCNPGSSPISSILTILNMACIEFSLTPEEALAGVTRNAAKALGLSGEYGIIAEGANAEFSVWNVKHPSELPYWIGSSPLHERISNRFDK